MKIKIKCSACKHPVYCFPSRFIDHEEVHHKLLTKIHEKIEFLENEAKASMVVDYRHGYSEQVELLKSLLEEVKA